MLTEGKMPDAEKIPDLIRTVTNHQTVLSSMEESGVGFHPWQAADKPAMEMPKAYADLAECLLRNSGSCPDSLLPPAGEYSTATIKDSASRQVR
jgi:hypothetical protein